MNLDSFEFVVYMIHACADRWHMTPKEVYQELEKQGCISQFLVPLYDILHTQSTDFVVQDIQEYMANRGVVLPSGPDMDDGRHFPGNAGSDRASERRRRKNRGNGTGGLHCCRAVPSFQLRRTDLRRRRSVRGRMVEPRLAQQRRCPV